MPNTRTTWRVPPARAGRLVIFHDPAQDNLDDEHVVCATADELVEKFRAALDDGLRLGHDFTILANVEIPGLAERIGDVYNQKFEIQESE